MTRARVNWPGHPLHGKSVAVDEAVTIEGLTKIGRLYACRVHPLDTAPIVLRESQLVPIAEPAKQEGQLTLF